MGLHFVIGPNGIGKTNLLDAIYYLCLGKSYFLPKDQLIVQKGHSYFRLDAQFDTSIKACIKCEPGRRKEYTKGDTSSEQLQSYIGHQPVVFISPDDIYTYIHDIDERRKFMNQTLVQTDHHYLQNILQYKKIQLQKLAAIKSASNPNAVDLALLDTYDYYLAELGSNIAIKRNRLVQEISYDFGVFLSSISNGLQEGNIEYQSDSLENLEEKLKLSREKDIFSRRLNCGIHKDKLRFKLNGGSLRQFGSQGQMKSFLLALRLAQSKYLWKQTGQKPILLLDDAFAKLDADRIKAFLHLVMNENIEQCFITDTHLDRARQMSNSLSVKSYIYSYNGSQFEIVKDETE